MNIIERLKEVRNLNLKIAKIENLIEMCDLKLGSYSAINSEVHSAPHSNKYEFIVADKIDYENSLKEKKEQKKKLIEDIQQKVLSKFDKEDIYLIYLYYINGLSINEISNMINYERSYVYRNLKQQEDLLN